MNKYPQSEEIEVKSAHEVDSKQLEKFFKEMYPGRAGLLAKNWAWFNRSEYVQNQTPLLLVHNERIMGHAATIPLDVILLGTTYKAAWFIDLVVHPDYRGQGLGTKLEKKNMSLFEMSLGFPNEKSKPLLEKVGWKSSPATFMHYYILKPLNIHLVLKYVPKFIRSISNYFYKVIPTLKFSKFSADIPELLINILSESSITQFQTLVSFDRDSVVPVRDNKYFEWRILNSPAVDSYRIVTLKNDCDVSFLIKLNSKNGIKFIDIMWISDIRKKQNIRLLLSTLAKWALKGDYSHIRFYTSNRETTEYLNKYLKPKIKNPPFIYYSKNLEIMEKMKDTVWNLDLFDSDFEWQV